MHSEQPKSVTWLLQRSDAHAQLLVRHENCTLRHIGNENLAMGAPIGRQSNVDVMRSAVLTWVDEGPGNVHYDAMVNQTLTRIGCSSQRGPEMGVSACWVVMCSYA